MKTKKVEAEKQTIEEPEINMEKETWKKKRKEEEETEEKEGGS